MLVIDVIGHSGLDSDYVQTKGPKMISDDLDTPSFHCRAAAKDAGLITDAARAAGLRLGIAETVRERLHAAVRDGLGRADVAAVYRLSRRCHVQLTDSLCDGPIRRGASKGATCDPHRPGCGATEQRTTCGHRGVG